MDPRTFSRSIDAGTVELAGRLYEVTLSVSAPVASPDALEGAVVFSYIHPRNTPVRGHDIQTQHPDRIRYSFTAVERALAAYDSSTEARAKSTKELAAQQGVNQTSYSVDVARGVLKLTTDAAYLQWNPHNLSIYAEWLEVTNSEADHLVGHLRKQIAALRALPPPGVLPGDVEDLELERRQNEDERLRARAATLESILQMEQDVNRRAQREDPVCYADEE